MNAVMKDKTTQIEVNPKLRVLDVREVAALLHVSRSRIFELLNEGKFPRPFRVGKRNLWREPALIAFLDRQERRAKVG